MKRDIYKIDNSLELLSVGRPTLFLDPNEFNQIKYKIKNYNVFKPYKDSEKVILYINELPNITLFKIEAKNTLKHQNILGSILALNINPSFLGDIIIDNDNYYFYIISELKEYIKNNLTKISNYNIILKEIDINTLNNYERKYEELQILVSSNRIDNVISKIINTNRDRIVDKIKNKDVILNYEILSKSSYYLKPNDIFSIRKYGKYKYIDIINTTKKNKSVIKILKYI